MKYILVSIKDRAVEAFMPIQTVRAPGEAIRAFQDMLNNPQNTQLHAHPDDFDLYQVGTFDDQSGLVETNIEKLADGKQIKLQGN